MSNFQDLPIELKLDSSAQIAIITLNSKKFLIFDPKNHYFIGYQNWSLVTNNLNAGNRTKFPVQCSNLVQSAFYTKQAYPDNPYQPTVVLYTNTKQTYLFTALNMFIQPARDVCGQTQDGVCLNEGHDTFYMEIFDSFNNIPDDGFYSFASFKLSAIPYGLLNYDNHILDIFPSSESQSLETKKYYDSDTYSSLLSTRGTVSLNSNNKNIIRVKETDATLLKFTEWNFASSIPVTEKNKGVGFVREKLPLREFRDDFNLISDIYSDRLKFQPTITVKVNNKDYYGVLEEINLIHPTDPGIKNLDTYLEMVVDTSRVVMRSNYALSIHDEGQDEPSSVALPTIPVSTEETDLYINIAEAPILREMTLSELEDAKYGLNDELKTRDVLVIKNNETWNVEKDFYNNGTIIIKPSGKLNEGILIHTNKAIVKIADGIKIINSGVIIVDVNNGKGLDVNELFTYFTGGMIQNGFNGEIRFVNNVNSDNNIIVSNSHNQTLNFTFINSTIKNNGKIIFPNIINSSNSVVTGINLVEYNEALTDKLRHNSIIFKSLISNIDKSTQDNYLGIQNTTIGINQVRYNSGSIIFGSILNGTSGSIDYLGNYVSENITQSTIGIKYMGATDEYAQYKGVDFKITNPKYGYGLETLIPTDQNERAQTEKISGCGPGSIIVIDSVENYSNYKNTFAIAGACGIFNMFQTATNALTHINRVVNYGYGEKIACSGIMNLLVNRGNVSIVEVMNKFTSVNVSTTAPSMCYGIRNVVQNGQTENKRDYLPPFPPKYYDKNGSPRKLDNALKEYQSVGYAQLYDLLEEQDVRFLNMQNITFKNIYIQGHISIQRVIAECFQKERSIGIGQYGGLSFSNTVMDDSNGLPDDITKLMKKYVAKYNPLSIIWSFPKNYNTKWSATEQNNTDNNHVRGQYLEEFFPKTNNGWIGQPELITELQNNGWYWEFPNPVQMYYKYQDGESSDLTDTIFFPINWGIVTIDYVLSGGSDGSKSQNHITGSAYGIEKAISAMGPIQINVIESFIEQQSLTLQEESSIILNTNDYIPEEYNGGDSLSIALTNSYLDLPVKYIQSNRITKVNEYDINDLPITINIETADVANPEDRTDGIWTTGTQSENNYCWPYHITSLEQVNNHFTHVNHSDLENEFQVLDENNDVATDFTYGGVHSSNTATSLLEALQSVGSAIGVYRTIDYGSNAPGLSFFMSFTQPIETEIQEGKWNNPDNWLKREYGLAQGAPFTIEHNGRFDISIIDYQWSTLDYNYGLCKLYQQDFYMDSLLTPSDEVRAMENFHFGVVRKQITNPDQKFYATDYMHYPFMSYNRNCSSLNELPPPGFNEKYVDKGKVGSWAGSYVKWNLTYSDQTDNNERKNIVVGSEQDLPNLVEQPTHFNTIKFMGEHDINMDFDSLTDSHKYYIYNSSLINSKLRNSYHESVLSENGSTLSEPRSETGFNGLTPFPMINLQSFITTSFGNPTYSARTFQDKVTVAEKILWNPEVYSYLIDQTTSRKDRLQGGQVETPGNAVGDDRHHSRYVKDKGMIDRANQTDMVDGKLPWAGKKNILNNPLPTYPQLNNITHDDVLKDIFNNDMPGIGSTIGSNFHLLKSSWPYCHAISKLLDRYYDYNLNPTEFLGSGGPLNSNFFTSERKDDGITSLIDTLSYHYSPTKPIGFNPQLIQGGLYKLEENHPLYNDLSKDGKSFLVVSKGKTFIEPLTPYEHEGFRITNYNSQKQLRTHDITAENKHRTSNRYYGFTFENRNPRAKGQYSMNNLLLGNYHNYKSLNTYVNTLINNNNQNQDEYRDKLDDSKGKQISQQQDEAKRREESQHAFWANVIVMALLPIIMGLMKLH